MAEYIPSPRDWVREQVELYERSGGTQGTTLRDTGLPVIIVTHTGNQTGAIRKTPLMRVKDGANYVLVGSQGGAPKNPEWVLQPARQPEGRASRPCRGAAHAGARGHGRGGAGAPLEAGGRGLPAVRGLPGKDQAANSGLRGGAAPAERVSLRGSAAFDRPAQRPDYPRRRITWRSFVPYRLPTQRERSARCTGRPESDSATFRTGRRP